MSRTTTLYRQCTLANGPRTLVTYLPLEFAQLGMAIKLRVSGVEMRGSRVFEDGWLVQAVHGEPTDRGELDSHDDIKRHRRTTGDAEKRHR